MPAIAALTIEDGAVSPVTHTYAPVTTDGSKAKWADRSPAIPAGFPTILNEVVEPNGQRTTYKHSTGFNFPTVADVNGVDQVVRNSSAQVVLNIHPDSTLQERKDMLAIVTNYLLETSVITSVENLEPHY